MFWLVVLIQVGVIIGGLIVGLTMYYRVLPIFALLVVVWFLCFFNIMKVSMFLGPYLPHDVFVLSGVMFFGSLGLLYITIVLWCVKRFKQYRGRKNSG